MEGWRDVQKVVTNKLASEWAGGGAVNASR